MRKVTLDIETTGLDPLEGHKIIEIGCVELINNFPTGKTWQSYINPNRNIPQDAYEVHGLTEEFLGNKPFFTDNVNYNTINNIDNLYYTLPSDAIKGDVEQNTLSNVFFS